MTSAPSSASCRSSPSSVATGSTLLSPRPSGVDLAAEVDQGLDGLGHERAGLLGVGEAVGAGLRSILALRLDFEVDEALELRGNRTRPPDHEDLGRVEDSELAEDRRAGPLVEDVDVHVAGAHLVRSGLRLGAREPIGLATGRRDGDDDHSVLLKLA